MPRSPKPRTNKEAITPVFSMRLDRETTAHADAIVEAVNASNPTRDPVTRSEVLRWALRDGLASVGTAHSVKPPKGRGR